LCKRTFQTVLSCPSHFTLTGVGSFIIYTCAAIGAR
jgi:hypothetical protein